VHNTGRYNVSQVSSDHIKIWNLLQDQTSLRSSYKLPAPNTTKVCDLQRQFYLSLQTLCYLKHESSDVARLLKYYQAPRFGKWIFSLSSVQAWSMQPRCSSAARFSFLIFEFYLTVFYVQFWCVNVIRVGFFKSVPFASESKNNNISPYKNTHAHLLVFFKIETAFPVRYQLRQKKQLRRDYDTRAWSTVNILLKSGENLLCGLGTTWKNTFTTTTFSMIVFFQHFKSRIITEQICQNFYTLITEEPVAFLDLRTHHRVIYSDISKKHISFIFKGFECPYY
jgi:hypothetical protein